MTPDAVRVDLTAPETSPNVRKIFTQFIKDQGGQNLSEVAVLTVISTYKAGSFIENPVLFTSKDGTQVTNFHDGLAKWAGTHHSKLGTKEYNEAVSRAIRKAEQKQQSAQDQLYGTNKQTLRFNNIVKYDEFSKLAERAGVNSQAKL